MERSQAMKSNINRVGWCVRVVALLFCIIIYGQYASAQKKKGKWSVPAELNFETWFDNREYKSENAIDQTLFGLRITPIVGLEWDGEHRLMIGGDFRAEFGAKHFSKKPEFIVYYNYNSKKFKAYAGVFPRRKMMRQYPEMFISDSLYTYDSNLEGALFQYSGKRGYVEFACDWLSMISDTDREKFVLLSSGELMTNSRKFYFGYFASMFHYSVSHTEDGVIDNILLYPYARMHLWSGDYFSRRNDYQHITLRVGWVQAMQRDRKHYDGFVNPGGAQIELGLEKWRVGINNTLYIGKNIQPYYSAYGPALYLGDPFYRTTGDLFNRTEIYWNAVRRKDINLSIAWHQVYDGKKWGSQQVIKLSINLNTDMRGIGKKR